MYEYDIIWGVLITDFSNICEKYIELYLIVFNLKCITSQQHIFEILSAYTSKLNDIPSFVVLFLILTLKQGSLYILPYTLSVTCCDEVWEWGGGGVDDSTHSQLRQWIVVSAQLHDKATLHAQKEPPVPIG
jgi:hypothetical protein